MAGASAFEKFFYNKSLKSVSAVLCNQLDIRINNLGREYFVAMVIAPQIKTEKNINRSLWFNPHIFSSNAINITDHMISQTLIKLLANVPGIMHALKVHVIIRENHHASVGRGWCKIAIATKWYQFHTTDKCGFLLMPWITDQYTFVRYTKLINKIGTAVAKVFTFTIMTT